MNWNHRSKCLTVLCLSVVALVGLAFVPGTANGAPPPGTLPGDAAVANRGTLAGTVSADQVNQTIGLTASSIVTLEAVPVAADVPAYVDVPINGELLTLDLVPHSLRADTRGFVGGAAKVRLRCPNDPGRS